MYRGLLTLNKHMGSESQNMIRRNYILREMETKESIMVSDLVKRFKVSEVTIRKDLEQLEKKNLLIKVRGGAIRIPKWGGIQDLDVDIKRHKNFSAKQKIGKAAAELIHENETIILDSGTTTYEIAKNLKKSKNLVVLTNAIDIASLLNSYKNLKIIVPGGIIRPESYSISGHSAEEFFKNFYCDKLFLGVDSLDIEKGLSTPNLEEASINKIMISIAKEVIAVADSSKFNKPGFALIAPTSAVHTIITDNNLSLEKRAELTKRGIKVIIA